MRVNHHHHNYKHVLYNDHDEPTRDNDLQYHVHDFHHHHGDDGSILVHQHDDDEHLRDKYATAGYHIFTAPKYIVFGSADHTHSVGGSGDRSRRVVDASQFVASNVVGYDDAGDLWQGVDGGEAT